MMFPFYVEMPPFPLTYNILQTETACIFNCMNANGPKGLIANPSNGFRNEFSEINEKLTLAYSLWNYNAKICRSRLTW